MNNLKLFCLTLLVVLVFVSVGCEKRRKAEDVEPKAVQMTADQLAWRDRLERELEGKLKAEFCQEAIEKKSLEYVNRLLDSAETAAKVGNLRIALKLKPEDDLDEFFNVVPERTLEQIAATVKAQAEAEIRKENNLLKDEDIPRTMRERLPLLPDKTKVEFKTQQGRLVSGMIVQRNKTLVKIGSKIVNREDAPPMVRAQIWPEENEAQIQQMIRDEQSKNRYNYKKHLPQKIAQMLPAALLAAGYVPNVFKDGASLKSDDIALWVTRSQLLEAVKKRVSGGQDAYVRDFWKGKGFVEDTLDGVKQWVLKEGSK